MAATKSLLHFDPQGLFVPGLGIAPEDLAGLYPALEAARQRLLADPDRCDQAEQLLVEYRTQRGQSELGRILSTARGLAETVDRLVVVAGARTLLLLRALAQACCHPYHNELSRAERGGQPRIYFAGDWLDNDALSGLVDLLPPSGTLSIPETTWGLIAIRRPDDTPPARAATDLLVDALSKACAHDPQAFRSRFVAIGWSCGDFEAGPGHETTTLFGPAALLPAATLGMDVRRLLEGAAAMHARFQVDPPAENLVLRYAGALHLMETLRAAWPRYIPAQAAVATLAKFATCFNLSTTSGQSQHRALSVNLIVEQPRRDRLAMGEGFLTDIESREIETADRANEAVGRPTAELRLQRCDESAVGQLLQMLALATGIEAELARANRQSPPRASI